MAESRGAFQFDSDREQFLEDAVVDTAALIRRVQRAVLDQRVLHDPEELRAVGADGDDVAERRRRPKATPRARRGIGMGT